MTVMTAGMMSSNTDEWETPQDLFDLLNKEFHFTLDVCANESNYKVRNYFTKKENGLDKSWWGHVCWMNPPYGKSISKWVHKASEFAITGGGVVVALLPVRTDTKWWNDVMKASELRFIKGRVRFGKAKNCAPFPSVIAIWGTPRMPTINYLDYKRSE